MPAGVPDHSAGVLGRLVGDIERFGADVWGRRATRLRPAAAATCFSIDDLDALITSAIRVPAIRLVRAGEPIAPHRFCSPTRIGNRTLDDVADARKVLDEYRRGATVVLQSLHRTWPPMSAWCARLERELGWPVQANAYLTPPGVGGLARHRDGHDVFVIQTHGTKRWEIDGPGEQLLVAGDGLYVPAGVLHRAATLDDAASLHVTIGVHRPSISALARAAVTAVVDDDGEGRSTPLTTPMPFGGHDSADTRNAVGALLGELTERITRAAPAAVESALRREPRPHLGGSVAAAVARPTVDDGTSAVVAVAGLAVAATGPTTIRCHWDGNALQMPAVATDAMTLLADLARGVPIRCGDLPGLDAEGRSVLLRRLADEGVVALVGSGLADARNG